MSAYKPRRTYDRAIKREAARLVIEEGRKAAEGEQYLGIGRISVGRWVREMILGKHFPAKNI